jgi:hypothetical protein
VLLAEGIDREATIVARHYDSAIDALRGKVGRVAGMSRLEAVALKHARTAHADAQRRPVWLRTARG